MKIIMGADPLVPPLTGIGRYTYELASRMPIHAQVEDFLLFSMGHWVSLDEIRLRLLGQDQGQSVPSEVPQQGRWSMWLRRRLSRISAISFLYSRISPYIFRQQLQPYARRGYLFHGPNFHLPPFDGPSVVTIHDLSTFFHPEEHPRARVVFMAREVRRVLDSGAHLITDTHTIRQEVMDYFGVAENRITAIHLGVDPQFHPRPSTEVQPLLARQGLSLDGYTLCVATIEPRKNIGRLLQAFRDLPREVKRRWPLVLCGGQGWKSAEIHEQIQHGQREGWLRYLGFVTQSELPILYAGAHGFIFPSLYEGFGLPVIEAMASGIPVLTSDLSVFPEISGGAALLVNPHDVTALREGIIRMSTDEEWRRQAKARGLQQAMTMDWDRCTQQTVSLYQKIGR